MKKEIQVWLENIRRSIDEIEEFLPERRGQTTFGQIK